MNSVPDTNAAVEWLLSWHPTGPWTVVTIDPAREVLRPPAKTFRTAENLREYIDLANGTVNVYFIPNRTEPDIQTTPTKAQITGLTALYVDLDLPKRGSYTAPTPENFDRLLRRVRALDPPPSLIVFSGGGYQAFWPFDELLPTAQSEAIEAAGKLLGQQLGSDAVQNINRLMRLPGTVNVPDMKKRARGRVPATATVIDANWTRRFTFPLAPTLPDDARRLLDEDATDGEPVRLHGLNDLPVKYQRLIRTGDASDYNDDRSRMVAAIVGACIRRGWDDEEIIPLLTDSRYGSAGHCLDQPNPLNAAKRQVQRLRDLIDSDWERTSHGRVDPASPKNIRLALQHLGAALTYDGFSNRVFINGYGPNRELSDALESELRVNIYDTFGFTPIRDTLGDVISTQARRGAYHPVLEYLDSLAWDGTPRLETWLIDVARVADSPYTRAVSRLMLLGACRRVRVPGSEFHEMLVLISPKQGTGKSSLVRSLSPKAEWFTDSVALRVNEQKMIEQLQGKWIVECGELAGIHAADVESLNALLSRNTDRSRMAYGHHPVSAPRQCVFFGTTNSETFLRGRENRRFWPVRVERVDIPKLLSMRDQLWAEASQEERTGCSVRLPPELWEAAALAQEDARYGEPWAIDFERVLGDMEGRLTTQDAWTIVGKPGHMRQPFEHGRIVEALFELGWESKVNKVRGKSFRAFYRGKSRRKIIVIREVDGSVSAVYQDELQPTDPAPREHRYDF